MFLMVPLFNVDILLRRIIIDLHTIDSKLYVMIVETNKNTNDVNSDL